MILKFIWSFEQYTETKIASYCFSISRLDTIVPLSHKKLFSNISIFSRPSLSYCFPLSDSFAFIFDVREALKSFPCIYIWGSDSSLLLRLIRQPSFNRLLARKNLALIYNFRKGVTTSHESLPIKNFCSS